MYKNVSRQIFVRDSDGGVMPFSPEKLQLRLSSAFQSAGLAGESYISDDIVLALEYTLRRAARPELIFSISEIDTALIRILESCGFARTAELYRQSSPGEQLIQLTVSADTLRDFLSIHLACSVERLAKIAGKCAEALNTLNIGYASPHLLLELARHYERETAETDLHTHPSGTLSGAVLTRQEIAGLLTGKAAEMIKSGVLRISGISPVFAGIRFTFSMEKLAFQHDLHAPLTELELYPALYDAAEILENARKVISDKLALPEDPPCLINIPDMFDFIYRMLGCTKADAMAAELANILCSSFKSEIYQLSFD